MTKPLHAQTKAHESMEVRRVCLWVGITAILVACGWTAFAKLITPAMIEGAYRGEGPAILTSIIRGLGKPLEELLQHWSVLTQAGLFACLGFWLVTWAMISPAFFRRFVGEATPGSLGAIRMLTCAILLTSTIWEDLASSALLPREMIRPPGMMKLLYLLPVGFEQFVASETLLKTFEQLTMVCLFLGLIGWKTRIVIPLGGVCYFLMAGIFRQYAWFYHTGLIPIYVMAVLSFTPCGDGWSLDRLWKAFKGQPVPPADRPSPVYGWSRYACWVAVALPYVAAGMSKIRNGGLLWWNATNMRAILFEDSLNPMEFDWGLSLWLSPAPDILFAALGLVAVFGELTFGLVLFSRTARLILPFAMAMMHGGIWFLQNVLFFDLILLQLVFYDFTKLRQAIGQRLVAKHGPIEILYDGLCPLCLRTVRLLGALDLFHRFQWVDFHNLDLTAYNRRYGLHLTPSDLEKQMYVISRGRVYGGFYSYRIIALVIPALWLIAPWLFLPGVSWLGEKVYGYIAHNRLKLSRCDVSCSIPLGGRGSAAVSQLTTFLAPLALSGLTVLLMLCWFYRVELYPLTGMQMYTRPRSGIVTYYKVLARRESGETSRARLEDAIRAMADGRYRKVIRMCFQPGQVPICEKFLRACGTAYNNKAHPGEKVTQFEIQKWAWDFRTNPSDPEHGKLVDRFVFSIKQ